MTLPVFLKSQMVGAPVLDSSLGSINNLLNQVLVTGFGTQNVTSASINNGLATFNFSGTPNFDSKDTILIAGCTNSLVNNKFRVVSKNSNSITVNIPGVSNGTLSGSINIKFSPLGWTRPFTNSTTSVFRQGGSESHKRFIRVFQDSNSISQSRFYIRGYENMTSANSGTGPFPDLTEALDEGTEILSPYGSNASPWAIIGTPRCFYLFTCYDTDLLDVTTPVQWATSGQINNVTCTMFGDLDRIQKLNDTFAQVISNTFYFPSSFYGSRNYNGDPSSRAQLTLRGNFGNNAIGGNYTFPNPANGNLNIFDAPLVSENLNGTTIIRGFLPGVLTLAEAALNESHYYFLQTIENITGLTGRAVIVCGYTKTGGEFLITLDEDWGDI